MAQNSAAFFPALSSAYIITAKFHAIAATAIMTAEAAEISFTKTLALILEALLDTVREFFAVSDEQMQAFTHSFLAKLPQHLRSALGISQPPVAA